MKISKRFPLMHNALILALFWMLLIFVFDTPEQLRGLGGYAAMMKVAPLPVWDCAFVASIVLGISGAFVPRHMRAWRMFVFALMTALHFMLSYFWSSSNGGLLPGQGLFFILAANAAYMLFAEGWE